MRFPLLLLAWLFDATVLTATADKLDVQSPSGKNVLIIKSTTGASSNNNSLSNGGSSSNGSCPIGFHLFKDVICWRVKEEEKFVDKYVRCAGNEAPVALPADLRAHVASLWRRRRAAAATADGDRLFWTDHVRAYERGAYVNWRLGDARMGEPLARPPAEDEPPLVEGERQPPPPPPPMCLAERLASGELVERECDEPANRLCVVPAYARSRAVDWGCPEGYLQFASPERSCVLALSGAQGASGRRAGLRATLEQARNLCKRRSNGHLLQRGYVYADHPEFYAELHSTQQPSAGVPLGMRRLGNNFEWEDLGETIPVEDWNFSPDENFNVTMPHVALKNDLWRLTDASQIYYTVMCEIVPNVSEAYLRLYIDEGMLYVYTNLDSEDFRCFTDSVGYYPKSVQAKEFEGEDDLYQVITLENGYYWCLVMNTLIYPSVYSEKVLYTYHGYGEYLEYAIMIKLNRSLTNLENYAEVVEKTLNKYILEQMEGVDRMEENESDESTDNPKTTTLQSTTTDTSNETRRDIKYKDLLEKTIIKRISQGGYLLLRSKVRMQSSKAFDKAISGIWPAKLTDFKLVYIRSTSYCNVAEATKEIPTQRVAVNRTITLGDCQVFECVGEFNSGAYWKESDQNESCVTTDAPTTTLLPTTTTSKPADQVTTLADQLGLIANGSAALNSTELRSVSTQINRVLNFGPDVEIPKTILEDLDRIVSRVQLPQNETRLKVVQTNFAIVVAERSAESPVAGLRVNRIVDGFDDSSVNILNTDEMGQLMTNTSEADLIVNISSLMDAPSGNQTRLSFVVFKNDNAFSSNTSNGFNHQRVNSRVLSVTLGGNETMTSLSGGNNDGTRFIDIHLRPYEGRLNRNETKLCAFWDLARGANGDWSTEGCRLLPSVVVEGLDTCRCTHLTHFAQIIRPSSDVGEVHDAILSMISYVGCGLSLLGLFVIGLTGALFKSWRGEFSNKIWMHLSAAVMILMLTFLLISTMTFTKENKVACVFLGATLHYSLLASFCWMMISAFLSYKRLVTVFSKSSSHRLLKSCLFGWIAPLVPIIILFCIKSDPYPGHWEIGDVQKKFCYPQGLDFWLSIFLPVALVVAANTILFSIIIYSVFLSSSIQRHGNTNQLYRSLTVSFLLFFLFGLTWVFGLFLDNIVLMYLFCITATLQGFILFAFFVLGNKKTRELWCVCLRVRDKKAKVVTTSVSTTKRSISNEKTMSLKKNNTNNANKPRSMVGNTNNYDSRFS